MSEELKPCEHKRTKHSELEGFGEYEFCLNCGLSRAIYEQMKPSEWRLEIYTLQQEYLASQGNPTTIEYDYTYTVPGNPRPQLRHRVRHIPGKAKLIRYKAKMLRVGGEVKGFYFVKDGRHFIYSGNGPLAEGTAEVNPETVKMIGKFGFSSIYDDPKSKEDKERIKMLLRRQAPKVLLEDALKVAVTFHMPRPKSHYGTGRNAAILKPAAPTICHKKKPDIDNLRKLLMDALTGILWKDDCIICQGEPIKRYSENPRTEIFIKVLHEAEPETEQEKLLWQDQKQVSQ